MSSSSTCNPSTCSADLKIGNVGDGHIINACFSPVEVPSLQKAIKVSSTEFHIFDPYGVGTTESIQRSLDEECSKISKACEGLEVSIKQMKAAGVELLEKMADRRSQEKGITAGDIFHYAAWNAAMANMPADIVQFMASSEEEFEKRLANQQSRTTPACIARSEITNNGDGLVINICALTSAVRNGAHSNQRPSPVYLLQVLDPFNTATEGGKERIEARVNHISAELPETISEMDIYQGRIQYAEEHRHSEHCSKVTQEIGRAYSIYSNTQLGLESAGQSINLMVSTPYQWFKNYVNASASYSYMQPRSLVPGVTILQLNKAQASDWIQSPVVSSAVSLRAFDWENVSAADREAFISSIQEEHRQH